MQWEEQWRPILGTATGQFAEVLATGDLAAVVPGCPGWTLADLAGHLGGIHQWAAHAVAYGTPDGEPTAAPAARPALTEWYQGSAADLIDVLDRTSPDAPAWTFGPHPRTAEFWRRRQVHETQMHLYDARVSQGADHHFDDDIARDGIDEVVSVFFPRQVRLNRTPAVDGALLLVPDGDGPVHTIAADGAREPGRAGATGDARATVSGPAEALLLLLWKRIGPEDVRLQVSGDTGWATSVLSQALTP